MKGMKALHLSAFKKLIKTILSEDLVDRIKHSVDASSGVYILHDVFLFIIGDKRSCLSIVDFQTISDRFFHVVGAGVEFSSVEIANPFLFRF